MYNLTHYHYAQHAKSITQIIKVTTDTNNHNACMTKHILPYNFNICYSIYLKLTDEIGIGMTGANIMH